jgi:sugar/nucleoside kinase (ribokinase family)
MSKISVIGDINIDVIPQPVSTDLAIKKDGQVFVDDLVYRRGGQGANFAVKLAKLGGNVEFHGLLGDDRHGRFLQEHLQEHKVTPKANLDGSIKTGTTLAVTWDNGERHYISHTENNSQLSLDDIDMDAVRQAYHVARRGIWFSEPMLDGGNRKLLKDAKEHGCETSIDLHWDPHWNKDGEKADRRREQFMDALEYADILMGNEEEIRTVTKENDLDAAVRRVRQAGVHKVVVHQGPDGSTIYNSGEPIKIPTEAIENPANPTGTGDAYDAGFLHAKSQTDDLREIGEHATQVALRHLRDEI